MFVNHSFILQNRQVTKEEFLSNLGKKVKFYRIKNKLSQSQLAEKLECSINTIGNIENGRCFALFDTIFKLTQIFNIEVYQLFIPDDMKYDDPADHIYKFSDQVKEFLDDFKDDYLKNLK